MANPIVMMDSVDNKMYVCIKTQDNSLPISEMKTSAGAASVDMRKIVENNYFRNPDAKGVGVNKYIIMEIDYLPIQRWVNITVIVDNKVMTLFMDGEIYSVKSVDEIKASRAPELDAAGRPIGYNLIVDKTEGGLYCGKNPINNKVTVNGYLSKVDFYNFAVSLNQVKHIYNTGPVGTGLLSKMGLQYGFRSPVYKLNENVK
jgi:hypothetical protein